MNPYSEKCKNGIKVALLIIELVRERLDLTLNEEIRKKNFNDLNDFLVKKKPILSKHCKIFKAQQEILYPKNQPNPADSSKEFDCTLCLTLLRELQVLDNIKENVERLRLIRNESFGHISSMELDDCELRRLSEFKANIFDNVYDKRAYENKYSIVARIEFSIYALCTTDSEKLNFEKKISNYLTMPIEDINTEQFMQIKLQFEELMKISNENMRNQLSDMGTKISSDFETVHRRLDDTYEELGDCRGLIGEQKQKFRNIEEMIDSEHKEQSKQFKSVNAKLDEYFERIEPRLENISKEHEYEKKTLNELSLNMDDMPIRITQSLAKKEEEILHRIFLKFDDKIKCIEDQIQINFTNLEKIIPKKNKNIEYECEKQKDLFDKLNDVLSNLMNEKSKKEYFEEGPWIIDHQKALKSLEEEILNKLDQISKERMNDTKNIESKLNAIEMNLVNFFSSIVENIKNESNQERYLIDYDNIVAKLDLSVDLIIQSIETIYNDNQEIKDLIKRPIQYNDDSPRFDQDNRDLLKRIFEILQKIDPSQFENLMKQFSDMNERTLNLFKMSSLKLGDDAFKSIYKMINEQMDMMIADLNEKLKKDFLEVQLQKVQKENEKLKRDRKKMPTNQYIGLDISCNDKNELRIECYDNEKNQIEFASYYFNKNQMYRVTNEEGEFRNENNRLIEKVPFNFSLSLTPDLKVSCIYFEGLSCDDKRGEYFASQNIPKNYEMPSEEFVTRLEREKAKLGSVSVSLMWNNENDLDLHVIDPNNEEIYYSNKKSKSGGELDVDMNASEERLSKTPVENIVWPWNKAPNGKYKIFVNYFAKHCNQDETDYKVSVYANCTRKEFSGRIKKEDGKKLVHEFNFYKEQQQI